MKKNKTTSAYTGNSTQSVHAGGTQKKPFHALIDPIVQSSNFIFENSADVCAFMEERKNAPNVVCERMEYGRYGNPTTRAVEKRIAVLEHGEEALVVSSGMAAITSVLFTFLKAGDHIVMTADCYRKTREFILDKLSSFGITATIAPLGNMEEVMKSIQPNTKLILSESPTNPYLRVIDVQQLAKIAQERNILTVIDSTFATPINLNPLDYGIDLVVHSATKYLAGHNDLLAGVVIGTQELLTKIRDTVSMLGCVTDPHNAFLLQRGLKTLGLRVAHQNKAGQTVAEFLEKQKFIPQVYYPGLASHPDHLIAKRLLRGCGGVVSFTVGETLQDASYFIDQLKIPYITPSLGAVESLVTQPAIMSYYPYTTAEREAIGIKDNLVRLALGIEDLEDILNDLKQALEKLSHHKSKHQNKEVKSA